MNRIDRLFAILLLIQCKRRVRALDLAQAFEVSERTIYRSAWWSSPVEPCDWRTRYGCVRVFAHADDDDRSYPCA